MQWKHIGRARLLARLLSLYPGPDLLIVLKAPAAPVHSRNQTLSEEETLRQTAVFEQPRVDSQRIFQVDAPGYPLDIAREILQKITAIVP